MTYSWFGPFKSKWKIVPLREIARLGTGHTPSREVEAYWENCTIPWVTVSDIRKHGASKLSPLRETEQKSVNWDSLTARLNFTRLAQ